MTTAEILDLCRIKVLGYHEHKHYTSQKQHTKLSKNDWNLQMKWSLILDSSMCSARSSCRKILRLQVSHRASFTTAIPSEINEKSLKTV